MSWLFVIFPALTWESTGIVSSKLGGATAQQTLGMSLGAMILGLGTLLFFVLPVAGSAFEFNSHILVVGFISGLLWQLAKRASLQALIFWVFLWECRFLLGDKLYSMH